MRHHTNTGNNVKENSAPQDNRLVIIFAIFRTLAWTSKLCKTGTRNSNFQHCKANYKKLQQTKEIWLNPVPCHLLLSATSQWAHL